MKAKQFRIMIADLLNEKNAFYGDNTGSFDEEYKINYQITNAILYENQRTYMVDFDVWCKDSAKVEMIADEIEEIFDYKTYSGATFYLDNRYHADEKEIYRRTLTYEVRTFNEGE